MTHALFDDAPSGPLAEPGATHGQTDLLVGLDPSQREAVVLDAAPMAILAGPGSGKTRVLTHRIAWQADTGRIDPAHTLAVTFTRKAAGELSRRLGALGVRQVTAGTVHAVALAQLGRLAADRGQAAPVLLERKARVLAGIVGGPRSDAWAAAVEIASEIEWAKASLVTPDEYAAAVDRAGRTPPRPVTEIAEVFARYETQLRRRHLVDFEDLLGRCAEALEGDAAFAAAQRWRFRHLFVDEFQDVSPLQLRLLRGWLGDRLDLCVVGDPDQAIYAFAGAEAGYLRGFAAQFPGAQVVRLEANYRSTPEIISMAEALLADAGARRAPRRPNRPGGALPTITDFDTDQAEAAQIVALLPAARATYGTWASIAILYRTNAQSALFEEEMARAGIPVRVRGDARFLERPGVRAALDALRRAERAAPGRTFSDHVDDLETQADALPSEREEQREHVAALVRMARDYLAVDGHGSIHGFLAHLTASLHREPIDDDQDAVQLLTFHRAKGLEFPVVFVTGLERGLVPISHATTPGARAEERRLLYVALSRASHELHLSCARQRTLGSRSVPRVRSPWLAPLEEVVAPSRVNGTTPARRATGTKVSGPAGAKAALAALRNQPDDEADPELLTALVTWRRNLARASGVPAYVIFPDTTLRAVAASKPTHRDALLALAGVGPVKIERHGDAVLELVRQHAR